MPKVHDIVETSRMTAETVNAMVYGTCVAQADMDNGRFIVANEALATAIYPVDLTTPVQLHASVDRIGDIVYGQTDFYVTSGTKVRAMAFQKGDVFATTAIDYSGDRTTYGAIALGDTAFVHINDGKVSVNNSATAILATTAFVGTVIEKKTLGYDRTPAIRIKIVRC